MRITCGKQKLLSKQLRYKSSLGINEPGPHGDKYYNHILPVNMASKGANFYCHDNSLEWTKLNEWANKGRRRKINFTGSGLRNLLRSEHIAYNIFYPLFKMNKTNPKKLITTLQDLLNNQTSIASVDEIIVEHTPMAALKDNTSFDTFISYTTTKNIKGAVGIEIKYTEKSYAYGKKEKEHMYDKTGKSIYLDLTKNSNYFIENAHLKLRERKLKQPWRNHLLGIAICENPDLIYDEFFSVHLFPEENTYQKDVAEKYKKELKDDYKKYFVPITYTNLIDLFKSNFGNMNWIQYLSDRY